MKCMESLEITNAVTTQLLDNVEDKIILKELDGILGPYSTKNGYNIALQPLDIEMKRTSVGDDKITNDEGCEEPRQ